jgi:hypothetical protein
MIAESGQQQWWQANTVLKDGQTTKWKIKHIFLYNTSVVADKLLLAGATVHIDSILCGTVPAVTVQSRWYRLTCKTDFYDQTVSGTAASTVIKVTGKTSQKLYIAGIKVFGFQSDVAASVLPRSSTQIQVNSTNVPYVLNDKGDIYKKTSSTWTKEGSDAKGISVDPSDNLWKIQTDTVWTPNSKP